MLKAFLREVWGEFWLGIWGLLRTAIPTGIAWGAVVLVLAFVLSLVLPVAGFPEPFDVCAARLAVLGIVVLAVRLAWRAPILAWFKDSYGDPAVQFLDHRR